MVDCDVYHLRAIGTSRVTAAVRAASVAAISLLLAMGPVVAHSGHPTGHGGGGSILVPGAILSGSILLIGAGAYLDHTGEFDGRLARLAVLLGIGGVLVGILTAV